MLLTNRDIQKLVDEGVTDIAFKYKTSADYFMNAWKKKGYNISSMKSPGNVIDSDEFVRSAYYCSVEENPLKPLTKEKKKLFAKMEYLDRLSKSNPRKYWIDIVRPRLIKKRSGLDPEIRQLIFELNDKGLFTLESCAGHKDEPSSEKGLIFFFGKTFKWLNAQFIMRKYGLTGIYRDEDYTNDNENRFVILRFNPIGKPRGR